MSGRLTSATATRLIRDATTAGKDMLTAADAAAQRTLISVYSTAEVDGIISGLGALTSEDIDTLAEINAIITDANFATVATTGAYADLSGLPTLGTAAATAATDYATAAQGAKADTALQPADIATGTITARADDINLSGGSIGDVITVQADGSLALATPAGGAASPLTLTAGDATETPLTIQGAASQAANLQEWRNSSDELLLALSAAGDIQGKTLNGMKLIQPNALFYTQSVNSWWVGGGFGVSPGVGYTFAQSTYPATPGEFGWYREGVRHVRLRNIAGTNCRMTVGTIIVSDLPTSDPAIAGEVWNDSGTLKISAG